LEVLAIDVNIAVSSSASFNNLTIKSIGELVSFNNSSQNNDSSASSSTILILYIKSALDFPLHAAL
jgi:hypothetical protein